MKELQVFVVVFSFASVLVTLGYIILSRTLSRKVQGGAQALVLALALGVAFGNISRAPITIVLLQLSASFPSSWYLAWASEDLLHAFWVTFSVVTMITLFVLVPLVFFYAEGISGTTGGRLREATATVALLYILAGLLMHFFKLVLVANRVIAEEATLVYTSSVAVSLFGALLLVFTAPKGFSVMLAGWTTGSFSSSPSSSSSSLSPAQPPRRRGDPFMSPAPWSPSEGADGGSLSPTVISLKDMERRFLAEEQPLPRRRGFVSHLRRILVFLWSLLVLTASLAMATLIVARVVLELLGAAWVIPLEGWARSAVDLASVSFLIISALRGLLTLPCFAVLATPSRSPANFAVIGLVLCVLVMGSSLPMVASILGISSLPVHALENSIPYDTYVIGMGLRVLFLIRAVTRLRGPFLGFFALSKKKDQNLQELIMKYE
jgi:hypothetical protein